MSGESELPASSGSSLLGLGLISASKADRTSLSAASWALVKRRAQSSPRQNPYPASLELPGSWLSSRAAEPAGREIDNACRSCLFAALVLPRAWRRSA
jgi:hypothetical protein